MVWVHILDYCIRNINAILGSTNLHGIAHYILGMVETKTLPHMQDGGVIMVNTHIEIDKHRNLRYDFNAGMDIENVMGVLWGSIPIIASKGSIKLTVAMLWAGLKWEDESLTMKDAADLATIWCEKSGGKFGDLNDVLITAIIESGLLNKPEDSEGAGQGESTSVSKT
jgi:hypothetical protein